MTGIIQTFAAHAHPRFGLVAFVAATLLIHAGTTRAAGTPEEACQKGRYSAAAQYSACQQKALAKFFAGDPGRYQAASGKCRMNYAAAWSKLQAKAPGSTCATDRFTDNGTTVTDNLTGLQWEKKRDLDGTENFTDPHDADNLYSWSVTEPFTAADGAAFTAFLLALNGDGCLAGQCDWRLPTISELQTIMLAPYPCGTSPCIDPVFGPTGADNYWSATTYATVPSYGWSAAFYDGSVTFNGKGALSVRAVRAGL